MRFLMMHTEVMGEMGRLVEEMKRAGVLLVAEDLEPPSEGARVSFREGRRIVVDGPLTESTELVAGFALLQVRSMDEAIEWASRFARSAGGIEVEVRQVADTTTTYERMIDVAKFATVEEYLAGQPESLREVGEKAKAVIDAALPGVASAMWHGHPVWSAGDAPGKSPVCLLKAYSGYVTFGLWRGQEVTDDSGRLEPGAREMAGVKLRTVAEIDAGLFTGWLHQALALETRPGN